jgi:hypothetical protein
MIEIATKLFSLKYMKNAKQCLEQWLNKLK